MSGPVNYSNGLASQYVYDILYNKIVSIDLKPGDSISIVELAKELGTSRTPVQRAATELAQNGLLKVLPQRGSYVSLINLNKVFDAFYMRNLMEQAAVSEVCKLSNRDKVIYELEQALTQQKLALAHHLYEVSFKNDEAFHHAIYKNAKMLHIEDTLAYISADQNRIRHLKVLSHLRSDSILQEHEAILAAIKTGDSEAASYGVYNHVSKFAEDTIAIHQRFPSYFSNWDEKKLNLPKMRKQLFFNLK